MHIHRIRARCECQCPENGGACRQADSSPKHRQQRGIECAPRDDHRVERLRLLEKRTRQRDPDIEGQRPVLEYLNRTPVGGSVSRSDHRPLQLVVAEIPGIQRQRQLHQQHNREHRHRHGERRNGRDENTDVGGGR